MPPTILLAVQKSVAMLLDLTKIPDFVKLEITKSDLEAFAQTLLAFQQQTATSATATKEILSIDEAAEYTGFAKQTLYTFTSQRTIPHFKRGKNILFKRSELESWMLQNRRKTVGEIAQEANTIPISKKGGRYGR